MALMVDVGISGDRSVVVGEDNVRRRREATREDVW